MPTEPGADANNEVTNILGKGWAWLKQHIVVALGALVLSLAAVVWRQPNLFVGVLAAAVMTTSALYAVAYIRLHTRALEREKQALAELEHWKLLNKTALGT